MHPNRRWAIMAEFLVSACRTENPQYAVQLACEYLAQAYEMGEKGMPAPGDGARQSLVDPNKEEE